MLLQPKEFELQSGEMKQDGIRELHTGNQKPSNSSWIEQAKITSR